MLAAENVILYYGTLIIGILVGFAASKLLMMILFKIIDIPLAASLSFSGRALVQTLIVFSVIDVLMMGMNRLFLKNRRFYPCSALHPQPKQNTYPYGTWSWGWWGSSSSAAAMVYRRNCLAATGKACKDYSWPWRSF
ncbi:hypothetical protein DI43_11920 [Geobacillus sp. CAMR12739]|nr:hypothetical protein DI43_11920 [Geobacillus sp. CAMR12739]